MKGNALILTAGLLESNSSKTAHGLIRKSDRFTIKGLIDHNSAGKDAGVVLDGQSRGIPIFANIEEAIKLHPDLEYMIIGVATPGGIIPDELKSEIINGIAHGLSIVNGLHHFLVDNKEIKTAADKQGVELIDIRKSRPRTELKFWSGRIFDVKSPIIAVLGTDCAVGKRTTARFLEDELNSRGLSSEMIFTGQTGMLQDEGYGFIFDTTVNDFVSGELEDAIVRCYEEKKPDVILLEGQSALKNPSGPCGSEYLLSAQAKAVILQAVPGRKYFKGWDHTGIEISSLSTHIDLIKLYDAEVIAITFNTQGLTEEEARQAKQDAILETGLPVILPLEDGVEELAEVVQTYFHKFQQ